MNNILAECTYYQEGSDNFYKMAEEWRYVDRLEMEVSNHGRVRYEKWTSYENHEWKMKKLRYDHKGVYIHTYDEEGSEWATSVQGLVARAFIGEPPFEHAVVEHINKDVHDNRPENLRYSETKAYPQFPIEEFFKLIGAV